MIWLDPRLWLVGLAVAGAAAGAWTARGYLEDSRRLAELRQQRLEEHRARERIDAASTRYEAARAGLDAEQRSLEKEVIRVVEKPVYRDVCLDDDGLRVLTDSIEGRDPGQPAAAVPAASAPGERQPR